MRVSTFVISVRVKPLNRSFEPWPFSLLIEVNNRLHTYRPKNDFLLLKHGLPRLAVEVNSTQNQPQVDRIRLMLQGASIVRFANTNLDAYKERKDFVFVAIYIDNKGEVERYLLYQDTGNRVRTYYVWYILNLMVNAVGFSDETNIRSHRSKRADEICSRIVQCLFHMARR